MIREGKAEGWLRLPITALQPWASLNDVQFNGVNVAPQVGREDRGCTVVARQKLVDGSGFAAVMTVPRDLILSLERVNEHAKYDQDFRNVLEAIGEFGTVSLLLSSCSGRLLEIHILDPCNRLRGHHLSMSWAINQCLLLYTCLVNACTWHDIVDMCKSCIARFCGIDIFL